jgi:hypothetical protein
MCGLLFSLMFVRAGSQANVYKLQVHSERTWAEYDIIKYTQTELAEGCRPHH